MRQEMDRREKALETRRQQEREMWEEDKNREAKERREEAERLRDE